MIGERLRLPFLPNTERRPSPSGFGSIVLRRVNTEQIVEEMAVPTRVIADEAQEQSLPIDPVATQASDSQESNRRAGYV